VFECVSVDRLPFSPPVLAWVVGFHARVASAEFSCPALRLDVIFFALMNQLGDLGLIPIKFFTVCSPPGKIAAPFSLFLPVPAHVAIPAPDPLTAIIYVFFGVPFFLNVDANTRTPQISAPFFPRFR